MAGGAGIPANVSTPVSRSVHRTTSCAHLPSGASIPILSVYFLSYHFVMHFLKFYVLLYVIKVCFVNISFCSLFHSCVLLLIHLFAAPPPLMLMTHRMHCDFVKPVRVYVNESWAIGKLPSEMLCRSLPFLNGRKGNGNSPRR